MNVERWPQHRAAANARLAQPIRLASSSGSSGRSRRSSPRLEKEPLVDPNRYSELSVPAKPKPAGSLLEHLEALLVRAP